MIIDEDAAKFEDIPVCPGCTEVNGTDGWAVVRHEPPLCKTSEDARLQKRSQHEVAVKRAIREETQEALWKAVWEWSQRKPAIPPDEMRELLFDWASCLTGLEKSDDK